MRIFKLARAAGIVQVGAGFFTAVWCASGALVLQNAGVNRNTLVNGSLISELEGNVQFLFDKAHISSDKATWHRGSGQVYFSGHIRIAQEGQLLTCDRMEFSRNDKKIIARKNIDFFDASEQIRLTADNAVYFLDSKHLTLTQNPMMYQYDTAHAETLSISGEKLIYNDSLQTASAENRVVILKGLLKATCSLAVYELKKDIAHLRTEPWIYYDIHELTGDSVDLFFIDKMLSGVSVMRNAKGFHRDVTPRDTIYTRVTGDSLFMDIARGGTIETIRTFGNATTWYYSSDTPELINEGVGKMMVLNFERGTTGTLSISGNAECVYYLDDRNESGKNEASGDRILIRFRDGKAHYIKMIGGVRGVYYAQRTD
jgi:lipopolysaccharide export system protein LptA